MGRVSPDSGGRTAAPSVGAHAGRTSRNSNGPAFGRPVNGKVTVANQVWSVLVNVDKRHTGRHHRLTMKPYRWDPDKNEQLTRERGLSFEQITVAIENGDLLQIAPQQNPSKYPGQKIMIVGIEGYAYLVPFVEEEDYFFLKTIIPSRKATREFLASKE